jgi:hypothetical protein
VCALKTGTQFGQWHRKKGRKSEKGSKRKKKNKISERERQGRGTAK